MQKSRPDRMVRLLTAMASLAYFAFCAIAALVLVALPAIKVFGGDSPKFHYGLGLPVTVSNLETTVQTAWGPAPVKLDEARAVLQLPISMLPWWLLTVLWAYAAAAAVLILMTLQNLRRIFQRVRDGAAFDAQNAFRLRTLSLLLLALAMLNAVAEQATAVIFRRGLAADSILGVPYALHVNGTLILVALVLMALAEVFRRGADLESDQALVI
jgi:hypothetical protein